jgi:hypothetical protein
MERDLGQGARAPQLALGRLVRSVQRELTRHPRVSAGPSRAELLARPLGPWAYTPGPCAGRAGGLPETLLGQAALGIWLQPPRDSATAIALWTERAIEHEISDLATERLTCILVVAEVLPGEDTASGGLG